MDMFSDGSPIPTDEELAAMFEADEWDSYKIRTQPYGETTQYGDELETMFWREENGF